MSIKAERYTGDFGFEDYEVLTKKSLNKLDANANSNKFYTMEIHEKNNNYRIFSNYGRLGDKGVNQVRIAANLSTAQREFDLITRTKIREGYREVELAQSSTGSSKAKELVDITEIKAKTTSKRKKKSTLDPTIQSFVNQIFDEAGRKLNQFVKGEVSTDGSSPLGKLSSRQIDKGRTVLQEISDMIANRRILTYKDAVPLTNEYYANIPKVFGHKISPEAIAISSLEKINEEMDILKFYEDSLRMGSIIYNTGDIDKQYMSLKSDIGLLDPQSVKYKELVEYVCETESALHRVHLKVKQIYTVVQKNAPKFDSHYGNVRGLFHGTRSANMPGILSTNLKLPNTLNNTFITGAMFGPGLYFSDCSTKSSQYSCSRFGGTTNKYASAFMFIADVALGKMHEINDSHYFTAPPVHYDSVKGCKGRSLYHNEYIIYRENQQRLSHIIEFEAKNRY